MNSYKHKTPIQIRFKDIDNLGHVNSAVHLTYFELSRVGYFNTVLGKEARSFFKEVSFVVAKNEMNYKQQILLYDTIFSYVWVSRIGTKSFDVSFSLIKKQENGNEIEVANGMCVLVCLNLKTNETAVLPEQWKQKMTE